eukprot:5927379-Amphidinium_carterae.1
MSGELWGRWWWYKFWFRQAIQTSGMRHGMGSLSFGGSISRCRLFSAVIRIAFNTSIEQQPVHQLPRLRHMHA